MTSPDGGKAFPTTENMGMSLRDYFAAAALPGLVSGDVTAKYPELFVAAVDAYRIADAMIEARKGE